MLQMKIAGIAHSVVNTTSLVANCGSRLYFADIIVVVAPAGIAASSTLTPVTTLLMCSSRQSAQSRLKAMSRSLL